MKIITVLLIGVIVSLLSSYSFASNQNLDLNVGSCGHENITIYYVIKEDYLTGCEGVARTKTFFTNYGYAVDIPVRIYFKQRINVNATTPRVSQELIYGCFDSTKMSIYMSSLTSPFVIDPKRVYFRIEHRTETDNERQQRRLILEEFHRSVITHEVAHLYSQHNFNLRSTGSSQTFNKMGHGVHEYIASVVQLSTMESTLLQRILQLYDPQVIFDHEEQINIISFACNPEKFNIMSFRHFHGLNKSQQQNLLDRILSNTLNPDLVFEFDH